jgi:predicted sugar kinase
MKIEPTEMGGFILDGGFSRNLVFGNMFIPLLTKTKSRCFQNRFVILD